MQGTIVNFRTAKHHQTYNQMIILVDSIKDKDKAKSLVGKKVVWAAPGKGKKEIKGKVSAPHGNKGAIRVLFETGMPGQAIGSKVKIE